MVCHQLVDYLFQRPASAGGTRHGLAWRRSYRGGAAAIAFVLPIPPSERRKVTDQYDVGQATTAIITAATDLGIGTGHSSVRNQDKARAILGPPRTTRWPTCSESGIRADPW